MKKFTNILKKFSGFFLEKTLGYQVLKNGGALFQFSFEKAVEGRIW